MQKFLLYFLSVIVISSITFAQMKLQLLSDVELENKSFTKKIALFKAESNSDNNAVPISPADATDFIPGSLMIGLLGDVTFPFGEEFKNYAGTGWSVHAFGGYSVLNSLILTAKVGYIKFGEIETDFGFLEKVSEVNEGIKQYNNQLIIAFGGQYLLAGLDPTCLGLLGSSGLQPYVAIALCLIFKSYFATYFNNFGINKLAETVQSGNEFEDSSTIFGITPSVGTYFKISEKIKLILSADYYYLFDKADEEISGSANINYLSINFGGAYSLW